MLVVVHTRDGKFDKYLDIESITYDRSWIKLWRTNELVTTLARTAVTLEVH